MYLNIIYRFHAGTMLYGFGQEIIEIYLPWELAEYIYDANEIWVFNHD